MQSDPLSCHYLFGDHLLVLLALVTYSSELLEASRFSFVHRRSALSLLQAVNSCRSPCSDFLYSRAFLLNLVSQARMCIMGFMANTCKATMNN